MFLFLLLSIWQRDWGRGRGRQKKVHMLKERATWNVSKWVTGNTGSRLPKEMIIYNLSGTRQLHKEYTWSFLMFNRRLQLRFKGLDLCLVSEKRHKRDVRRHPSRAECYLLSPSLALLVQRSVSQEPENLPNPSPVMSRWAEAPLIYVKPSKGQSCLAKDCQTWSMNKRNHWPGGQLTLFIFRDFVVREITKIHFGARRY